MNQSINTDSKNSKEPQQKYRFLTGTLEQKKTNSWTPVGQATDKKLRPKPTKIIALCRGHHWVWRPTHRRAIKEGSKVINRDWVKH